MSPLPGIFASAITGNTWTPQGAWDAIASVELASAVTSIDFQIPSGYKYLIVRGWNLSTSPSNGIGCRFNGDTAANYNYTGVDAASNGTTASGFASINTIYVPIGYTATATYPGVFDTTIYDIDSTNKTKTTRTVTGNFTNGTSTSYLTTIAGVWNSFAQVSSVTVFHGDNTKVFNTGSSFYIYGVK